LLIISDQISLNNFSLILLKCSVEALRHRLSLMLKGDGGHSEQTLTGAGCETFLLSLPAGVCFSYASKDSGLQLWINLQ